MALGLALFVLENRISNFKFKFQKTTVSRQYMPGYANRLAAKRQNAKGRLGLRLDGSNATELIQFGLVKGDWIRGN
jgi:hypothetical protein